MKRKKFNTTGLCIPGQHYMVDVSGKIHQIIENYIDAGEYFTINRARQYGKTTMLYLLWLTLKERYVVINISFEGKEEYFSSLWTFANGLNVSFYKALKREHPILADIFSEEIQDTLAMEKLGDRFTLLCEQAGQGVLLMIDEVDRAADNDVFLAFLGMLRERYLNRAFHGESTFASVILSGVHDIKNLKMKIRPDERHSSYNSPWNVAVDFNVDMSFSNLEISTMLSEYEKDVRSGMDIEKVSEVLYDYTGGYPFLVSWLCRQLDEKNLSWNENGVRNAVSLLLRGTNTLFDDIIKNLENHPDFRNLVEAILLQGEDISYVISNPDIARGVMYGIFKNEDGRVKISNRIFESYIYEYLISVNRTRQFVAARYADKQQYIENGRLNMETILKRFSAFMKSEYRDEDGKFIEQHGRLLFLSFLRPIINGTGHYAVESETRRNTRMDIQVFYGNEEYICELKIWHGEKKEMEAYDQLAGYLTAKGAAKGYLLSFCDNQKSPRKDQTVRYKNVEIVEVVVSYRDKNETR